MEFNEIIDKFKEAFNIENAVKINKEDGEVIETFGNENVLLNDLGAFIGSAGEIISKKLNMQNTNFIFLKTLKASYAIINEEKSFMAFQINDEVLSKEVFDKYKDIFAEKEEVKEEMPVDAGIDDLMDIASSMEREENKLGEIERKLLQAKIIQLNYLVNEFAGSGDKAKWIESIKEKLDEMENIKTALDIEDQLKIKKIVPVEISRDDIQKNTKVLIDTVCKVAVKEFGAAEAKKKVQNVIMKLNKK